MLICASPPIASTFAQSVDCIMHGCTVPNHHDQSMLHGFHSKKNGRILSLIVDTPGYFH